MNKIKITLLIISTAILMTACQDPEKGKLDNRVIEYWNYKINKDFKNAYQFLSPGWRNVESDISYIQRMSMVKVAWLGVSLIKKTCLQEDLCKIGLSIEYEYTFKGARGKGIKVETNLDENWLMVDNVWYNVPEEAKLK